MSSAQELFQAGCALVAAPYADRGFKYAKSGPELNRKEGEWTFRIAFLRGRSENPEHAKLWISARVLSKRLKEWRATQARPLRSDDHVGGGQIGNLGTPADSPVWTFQAADGPPDVVQSAQSAIDRLALPYFAMFTDRARYDDALARGALPEVSIGAALEILVSEARKDAAEALGRRFLRERPQVAPTFAKALNEIRDTGKMPSAGRGDAYELAHAAAAYGLNLES